MKVTTTQLSEAASASETTHARAGPRPHQLWASPDVPPGSSQTWWVHLWSGLPRDPTARHYKTMGNAVWLYLFLLISANRRDGIVLRKEETIALQTGISQRTVARMMQDLRDKGYITSFNNGRYLRIQITKWRPISSYRKTPK